MQLSKDEKSKRSNSEKIGVVKNNYLETTDHKESYVFISYKSHDWKTVLEDIVYELCRRYGLKVYFDASFQEDNTSWFVQMKEHIKSDNCKAILAFISDEYLSSYAVLMELMYSGTLVANRCLDGVKKEIVPIQIKRNHTTLKTGENSGLGTVRFSDNTMNNSAAKELREFNKIFRLYNKNNDFRLEEYYEEKVDVFYEAIESEGKRGEIPLEKHACAAMINKVLENIAVGNVIEYNEQDRDNVYELIRRRLDKISPKVFDPSLIKLNDSDRNFAETSAVYEENKTSERKSTKIHHESSISDNHNITKSVISMQTSADNMNNSSMNVKSRLKAGNYDAVIRIETINGKEVYIVEKGSRLSSNWNGNYLPSKKKGEIENQKAVNTDCIVVKDIMFDSISTLGKFVTGNSISASETMKKIEKGKLKGGEFESRNNTIVYSSKTIENNFGKANNDYEEIYHFQRAKLKFNDGKFVLLKGSIIHKGPTKYYTVELKNKYEQLLNQGILTEENGVVKTMKDIEFNSISSAGVFVSGLATNGWIAWENEKGERIDKIRQAFPDKFSKIRKGSLSSDEHEDKKGLF